MKNGEDAQQFQHSIYVRDRYNLTNNREDRQKGKKKTAKKRPAVKGK